jgi:DNA-binding transcriptional regulator YdaS (Cro superfamily)
MRLDEYLTTSNLTNAEFAKRIGVSTVAVQYWRHGQRIPRPAQMQAIREATKGEVTPNDFLPEQPPESAAEPPFTEAAQ